MLSATSGAVAVVAMLVFVTLPSPLGPDDPIDAREPQVVAPKRVDMVAEAVEERDDDDAPFPIVGGLDGYLSPVRVTLVADAPPLLRLRR